MWAFWNVHPIIYLPYSWPSGDVHFTKNHVLTYEVSITSLLPLPSSTSTETPQILSQEFAFAPYDLVRIALEPPHLEMPGRLLSAPRWPVTDRGQQNTMPLPQGGAMLDEICAPELAEGLAGLSLGPQGSSAPSPAPSPENIPPINHTHPNPCLRLLLSSLTTDRGLLRRGCSNLAKEKGFNIQLLVLFVWQLPILYKCPGGPYRL